MSAVFVYFNQLFVYLLNQRRPHGHPLGGLRGGEAAGGGRRRRSPRLGGRLHGMHRQAYHGGQQQRRGKLLT